jgi:phosphoglycolate phosphatase
MPLRPQLIVFDLDGTLVDSAPDIAYAIDAMLDRLGRPPVGEARVKSWIGNGVSMIVKRALTGELWPVGEPPRYADALKLFVELYGANVCERSRLFPGVVEGLQQLKRERYILTCITNKHSRFTQPLLEHLDIAKYMDFVGCGDHFEKLKPDPFPLLKTAERFNVPPARAMMIGDSANDVEAARAAGFSVYCVPYGYHNRHSVEHLRSDAVIDSIAELPALLAKLS